MAINVMCDECGNICPQEQIQMISVQFPEPFQSLSGDVFIIRNEPGSVSEEKWMTNINPNNNEVIIACSVDCAKKINTKLNIVKKNMDNFFKDNPGDLN